MTGKEGEKHVVYNMSMVQRHLETFIKKKVSS